MHGDFVADQILLFRADHTAVFKDRFQFSFIQQLEALRRGAGANPFGQRQLNRVFHRQRNDRQRTETLTQQRQRIFGFFRARTINHDQIVDGIDPHHCLAEAAKGARQQ